MARLRGRLFLLVILIVVVDVLGVGAGPVRSDAGDVWPESPSAAAKGRLEMRLVTHRPGKALQSCSVLRPGGAAAVALAPAPDKDGLSLLGSLEAGECGVRVQPVLMTDEGQWTLRADYKDLSLAAVEGRAAVVVFQHSGTVAPGKPSVDEGRSLQMNLTLTLVPAADGVVPALSECAVTTPRAGRIQLKPGAAGRVAYAAGRSQTLSGGWCAVRISSAQPADDGAWVLEATDAATGVVYSGRADVTVHPRLLRVRPARPQVEVGETAVLRLAFDDNKPAAEVRGCQAVRPDGSVVQVAGAGPSAAAAPVADGTVQARAVDAQRGELCAVALAPLGPQHHGAWALAIVGADGIERRAAVQVFVKAAYKSGSRPPVVVKMGTEKLPLVCGPDEAVACSLTDPAADLVASFRGPCVHSLDRVRAAHAGNWTCSVLLEQYAAPVQDWVVLRLAAPVQTRTGVQPRGQDVLLQCSLEGDGACGSAVDYCRLESPDGELHIVRDFVESVRAGRLVYAGRGMRACDCSVLLRGPLRPRDYGVWRCIMGYDKIPAVKGGLITVAADGGGGRRARGAAQPEAATAAVRAVALRVPLSGVVRPNRSMTVGCRADRALSYCWLRAPLGDLIEVEETSRDYAGLGFALGECAATVTAAANHSGTWHCGMGFVSDGEVAADLEVAVDVLVTESLVVPLQRNVTPSDGTATLGCRTALSEGLQYCRFQRPDGASIHVADARGKLGTDTLAAAAAASSRYRFNSDAGGLDKGFCAVTISPTDAVDLGEWTCAVALAGDLPGKEQKAVIGLADDNEFAEAALIGVGLGLVALVTVVAAFVGYRRYRAPGAPQRSARYRRQGRVQDQDGLEMEPSAAAAADTPPGTGPTTRSRARRQGSTPTSAAAALSGAGGGRGMPTTRLPSRTSAVTRWGNMFGDVQAGEDGAAGGTGAAAPNAAEGADDDTSSGASEEWKIR